MLDICAEGSSMEVSPPIQFRIEWADSQGKVTRPGCRPNLTFGVSSVSQPGVKTDVPPATRAPTLASLVSGVAGLRVYRPQNPVDQLAVSRGILEDVPSRERSDQILLRKHTIRRCPPKPLAIHTYRCPSARGNSHHLNPYLKPSSASINGVSDCFTQSFDTICSPSHMPSCRSKY